jgi:hypothetical protein
MSSVPFETTSGWSWPEEFTPESSSKFENQNDGTTVPADEGVPRPDRSEIDNTDGWEDVPAKEENEDNANEGGNAPRPQRHYPPRTCRICFETVLPSFEPPPEGVASFFNPEPTVHYISEDPESGRLIRPCKCTGSSRYVHEGCLQAWRHADPAYKKRNFWECPTCKFRYRLERMRWSRWISSRFLQVFLTIAILFVTVFMFGFIADPIINLYLDPYETIISIPSGGSPSLLSELHLDDEDATWAEHFLKGLASLGLMGFAKALFTMSPFRWWSFRTNLGGGGGRRGRATTGRDRLEDISWSLVFIGVVTFLYVSLIKILGSYENLVADISIDCVEFS